VNLFAQDIDDFSTYDLISFSNIFDWLPLETSKQIIENLSSTMKPGSHFLLRQLNNDRDYSLGEHFTTTELQADASLFYNKITTYERV
jgi:chemotaxis methyl-accepting protein methylase